MRTLVNHSSDPESLNAAAVHPSSNDLQSQSRPNSIPATPATRSPTQTTTPEVSGTNADVEMLDAFLENSPSVKYIWIQFHDYTATQRQRMVPIAAFRKQLTNRSYIGITKGVLRLLQDETMASGGSATGQFLIRPDLSTITLNKALSSSPSATVQTFWLEDGPTSHHLPGCPRWTLQKQVNALKSEHNISILLGCEIEIVFMRPVLDKETNTHTDFLPLYPFHSWSNMAYAQLNTLPMIEEIVSTLAEVDIHLPQFHTEAAPGQWEFPLPAAEPLKAIDMLITARDVIRRVAKKHGLKATLYPRPYDHTCGSACHTHFSIHGPGDTVAKYADSFLAGVLEHLPAIMALTLPLEESYARVQAGIWAGGEYVAWGSQNREVPLRKCGAGHWELKTVDGVGNTYLGVAALLASGLDGVRQRKKLWLRDCASDPSQMSEEGRREVGIQRMLPKGLKESLRMLERDRVLNGALGEEFVGDYVAVKRKEMEKLGGMVKEERRRWLIERY